MADGGRRWVDAGIDVCTGEARGRYQRGWKHLLTVTAKLMVGAAVRKATTMTAAETAAALRPAAESSSPNF